MKICFVSTFPDAYCYGIRILSAVVKKEGFDSILVFLPKPFYISYTKNELQQLCELIYDCDIVGISIFSNFFDHAVQVTKAIRDVYNDKKFIIWGGIHPTVKPEECLEFADGVCVGEGEIPFVNFIKAYLKGYNYHNIDGIMLKNSHNDSCISKGELVKNLDSLPFQDYDLSNSFVLNKKILEKMSYETLEKYSNSYYLTFTSRGCPYSCTFCNNNVYNRLYQFPNAIRLRSPYNVISELKNVISHHKWIKKIIIADDTFIIREEEEITEFANIYKKEIKIPFSVIGITPRSVNPKILGALIDAGLSEISIGIQSTSKKILDIYKRLWQREEFINTINKAVKKYRDRLEKVEYYFILDNPWEKEEDVIQTLKFANDLPKPCQISLFSLTFYPGTEIYELAKKDGLIKNDVEDIYRKRYRGYKKTYLNMLFFLLGILAQIKITLPSSIINLLTLKIIRKTKIGWLMFFILLLLTINMVVIYVMNKIPTYINIKKHRSSSTAREYLYTLYLKLIRNRLRIAFSIHS